jgi:UDP:flavonoid glycosyltransferase YjiC (YdhE family)
MIAAAGEHVIYVATGTMVVLTEQQIRAMAEAFQTLAAADTSSSSSSSSKPVRVIWSLKESTQQMLPAELRSSSTAEQDSGSSSSSSRVLVLPWINQAAVLAHPAVKLFVSHGGLGSTNEGLSAGA